MGNLICEAAKKACRIRLFWGPFCYTVTYLKIFKVISFSFISRFNNFGICVDGRPSAFWVFVSAEIKTRNFKKLKKFRKRVIINLLAVN